MRLWKASVRPSPPGPRNGTTFDDPFLPRQTTVVDPLGNSATYFLDGDRASRTAKARLVKLSGDCPTCRHRPEQPAFLWRCNQSFPGDLARGERALSYETRSTFNSKGQLAERIEVSGTPAERTTTWTFDANYPGL